MAPPQMHPSAHKPFVLSVKALLRDQGDRYLLLRRNADTNVDPGLWDLPGGKVEPGEGFEAALLREVREETGIAVALERLVGAAQWELPDFRVVHVVMAARLAEDEASPALVRVSIEHDEHRWVPRSGLVGFDLCPGTQPIVAAFANKRPASGFGP